MVGVAGRGGVQGGRGGGTRDLVGVGGRVQGERGAGRFECVGRSRWSSRRKRSRNR